MTSVVAGELSPYVTGVIYCEVLEACLSLADVRRAGEWSEAARAWSDSLAPESPFPGLCRVFRAEVARLRGDWSDAEAEAARASEELMGFSPVAAASAIYETGEIRLRLGDHAGAETAFARAHELGHEPQPGLALLSGRHPGHIPFRTEGLASRVLLERLVLRFLFHRVLTVRTPIGRKARHALAGKGGHSFGSSPKSSTPPASSASRGSSACATGCRCSRTDARSR